MAMPPAQLDRFVRALHRRLVMVRALECAGLGALAGCCFAAGLIPLLLWRDQPAMPPTAGALIIGALAGFVWGATRRPSRLDAAAEADRQLGLADLIGTAWAVKRRDRESDRDAEAAPWIASVLVTAEAACARHAPADVIFRRLNARTWGGIALAAVVVVSVAGLVEQSPDARAAGEGATGSRLEALVTPLPRGAKSPDAAREQKPSTSLPRPSQPTRDPSEEESANESTQSPGERSADATGQGRAGDNGSAGGSARARTPKPPSPARPESTTAPARAPEDGPIAGGAGSGAGANSGTIGRTASGTASGQSAAPTPPWRSADWPDDVRRAHEALGAGRVPDAYRDLVREYFDRE